MYMNQQNSCSYSYITACKFSIITFAASSVINVMHQSGVCLSVCLSVFPISPAQILKLIHQGKCLMRPVHVSACPYCKGSIHLVGMLYAWSQCFIVHFLSPFLAKKLNLITCFMVQYDNTMQTNYSLKSFNLLWFTYRTKLAVYLLIG